MSKTNRKKPAAQKRKTGVKKPSTKQTKMELERSYKIKYELKLIALVAVTLLFMFSLYTQTEGVVVKAVSSVFLGLFSFVAYVMPIVIFILFFVNLNPNFRPARLRISASMILIIVGLLVLSTLLAYDGIDRDLMMKREGYFSFEGMKTAYGLGKTHAGGGVFGDILTISITKLIGLVGAYIVVIVSFLMGFIIFTRVSLQDLWELKKKASLERKAQKEQILEIEASIVQEKELKRENRSKTKPVAVKQEDELSFIGDLEQMRRASRKKDLSVFDYDTYDAETIETPKESPKAEDKKASTVPASTALNTPTPAMTTPSAMGTAPLVNQAVNGAIKQTVKPDATDLGIDFFDHQDKAKVALKNTQPEKLKNSDIDPQTRQIVQDEIRQNTQKSIDSYRLPPIEILKEELNTQPTEDKNEYIEMAKLLEETLNNFNVDAKVVSVKRGPSITMFEVQPSPGVKVSKIVGLSDDIALNLATSHVRIAPIPGKVAIGIEVPNKVTSMVTIKEVITSSEFKKQKSKLTIGLGKDISGNPIIGDLASMPHLLIAGATGSGKSVCVNTIISSILFNAKPDEVKFLMIDPKVVELSNYNGIPHLILPVVTDPKKASIALNWAVNEMTRRYKIFAEQVVRDMKSYNKKAELAGLEILPQIVVIIDELADLMMVAPNVVEDAICRLAQMARAAGIHLIVATQRPSVDVITGLIKANIPSRIAFSVSSSIDSRTIIDMGGAEKLLGKGDMLYYPIGASKPKRAQGAFMSDDEVEALVNYIKSQDHEIQYNEEILDDVQSVGMNMDDVDEYLEEAIQFVIDTGQASASLMQRRFRVGYNRAARLVDSMEERGIIGPSRGSKPREVLITADEFKSLTNEDEYESQTNYEDDLSDESEDDQIYESMQDIAYDET